jgi:hypothetical protein
LALSVPQEGANIGQRHWWTWLVVFWIGADLLVAGWGLNPGIDVSFYTDPSPSLNELQTSIGEGRVYLSPKSEHDFKYQRFLRFDTFEPDEKWMVVREAMLHNVNMLADIPFVNNFDPMVSGRYQRWMEALTNIDGDVREEFLDLMGVYVIEEVDAEPGNGVQFIPLAGSSRFRWIPCADYVGSADEALEAVFSGKVNFENHVIIEGAGPTQISDSSSPAGQIQIEHENPNEIILQINGSQSGWVLISDVWYPGWRAMVDGNPVPVRNANYLFRGIEVPAGHHTLRLVYLPLDFYLGLVISVASWCVQIFVLKKLY